LGSRLQPSRGDFQLFQVKRNEEVDAHHVDAVDRPGFESRGGSWRSKRRSSRPSIREYSRRRSMPERLPGLTGPAADPGRKPGTATAIGRDRAHACAAAVGDRAAC
jgi:hypothetical protein